MVLWFVSRCAEIFQRGQPLEYLSGRGSPVCRGPNAPRRAGALLGQSKALTTSRDGKVLILKMAVPGEALGLSAVISGTPYELTAETAGPCQVNFIDRDALMKLLDKYGELGLHSAQALSREFQSAYRDIHELVLARSSAGKLAGCCSPGARAGAHRALSARFESGPASRTKKSRR